MCYKDGYLYITFKQYRRTRLLYCRRKGMRKVASRKENGLPDGMEWYEYKGRMFIFRKRHAIASFIISNNRIYRPLEVCGAKIIYLCDKKLKPTFAASFCILSKDYIKDFEEYEIDRDLNASLNFKYLELMKN